MGYIGLYVSSALLLLLVGEQAFGKKFLKKVPKDDDEGSHSKTLLSRLYGPKYIGGFSQPLREYTCEVDPSMFSRDLSLVTVNGGITSMTAVLVGYGLDESVDTFRGNKGWVYGIGTKKNLYYKLKNQFSLTVDYNPPEDAMWDEDEFCILLFSPALTMGPSLKATIGKPPSDARRNFGSTENLTKVLLDESPNTRSKLVTQCCFIMGIETTFE
ncbi:hypothetical protein BgAZ_305040 [Babesia gibsoni]|uniref:Uncharacterized protein n=1 Tax=Babesia gibsoni TaxID=33632 RepID=A0AAD8LPR8_BABGI|nr:hypothetical protein BgAZ_305040 [Babesia gibsoni]